MDLTYLMALFAVFLVGFLLGALIISWMNHRRQRQVDQFTRQIASQNQAEFAVLSMQALEKASSQFLRLANETLSKQSELSAQELEGKKALIDQTLQAMHKELNGVNKIVIELEKDRVRKFSQLSQQLKTAAEQTGKLQETTNQLHAALSNSQARGQWGERMAEDVLRMAGFIEGVNYLKQEASASRARPDFTFLLPKGLKLNMDVKFPLDNYIKYVESSSQEDQQHYKTRFLKDVKSRINEVTNRAYINRAENTVDYVLVFIPNEQIFAFITENDESLCDQALTQKVVLCSPLTLFAVLAVIRQAVDNFYIEERAVQILNLLAEFRKQWSLFVDSFDSLGRKLESAQKEYERLVTTRQNQLEKRLEKIDDLRQHEQSDDLDKQEEFLEPPDQFKYKLNNPPFD